MSNKMLTNSTKCDHNKPHLIKEEKMSEDDNKEILDDDLRVRIDSQELAIFKQKSQRTTGKPYQLLLREIISAFNDGRLRIIPTEEQNGELYDVN